MTDRLKKELVILRSIFPETTFHADSAGWFFIPRYTVQHGGWKQALVTICFQVPPGYPGEAPYGFWVLLPFCQLAGESPPTRNYQHASPTPFPGIWGKFSWSHMDSWKPGACPATGSNFLSFALSFRDRFGEGP